VRASFVLTPPESKRLIAKAVTAMPEVQKALNEAYLIICEGSTNTLIVQELVDENYTTESFTCGMNNGGLLCRINPEHAAQFPLVVKNGLIVDLPYEKALEDFHLDTVIIKGGNALDREGLVGVIASGFDGGSVAKIMGTAVSQGNRIVCPIGLEKLIFSVPEAAKHTGAKRFDYSMGIDYGMFVLPNPEVVTELEAIKILTGSKAVHVASGGIGGSEGSVVLSCEGSETEMKDLINLIESIKGEKPMKGISQKCKDQCRYVNCMFYGKDNEELPEWLRIQKV